MADPDRDSTPAPPAYSLSAKLEVCQHVAHLVRAQLPIPGELAKATRQAPDEVSQLATSVDADMAQGKSLAASLARDDSPASRVLAACIEAGEASRALDRTLHIWTDMHLANAHADRRLRTALVYPTLLIAVTLFSLSLVIWTLIPQYQETYTLFDQELPGWLVTIVWVRERYAILLIVLLLLAVTPLGVWYFRRYRRNAHGQPIEGSRRLRLQALAAEIAAIMLDKELPLKNVSRLSVQAAGGSRTEVDQAFSKVQSQSRAVPLSDEISMMLSALQAGVMGPQEATRTLKDLSSHLRQSADLSAARQARWIPMLVALTIGGITILTYVFLIYLPWIWLMQRIVA